jgi:photosynthetic reaction center cytochrome c subunit
MRRTTTARIVLASLSVLTLISASVHGQSAASPHSGPAASGAPGAAKTAGEQFKNIQVLKDIPAGELIPSMQFMAGSLGVDCEFCHVHGAFDKDDKEEKQTARKMITMMFAINKDHFGGEREVTCNTCHHGANDPASTPAISETEPKHEEAESANAPALPNAAQILDHYVQALGGEQALHKFSSRVEKGTLSGFGAPSPVEVFAKAPDARVTVVHTERGENVTAYNGRSGWMSGFGPSRPITGGELDNEKRNADFYFAADIAKTFQQVSVGPRTEKVGDHESYVLMARNPDHPPVRFYFDKESGLLLREMRFVETPLGRNPSEVDYADYRDVEGVKLPFQWTIARPGGRFTIKIDSVQQNAPIDDARFAPPAAPAGGGR